VFWNRFFDECSKKGTSPNAVCKAIGLSNATATGWKNGTLPKADVLVKIAKHLDVSVDYLLGIKKETPLEPLALKASKSEWIYILERMSDENLIKLRDYALLLLMSQDQDGQGDQGSQK
jgi:transcriptional regulator with XRE-family HTH domain